jgi:hypothetical protein
LNEQIPVFATAETPPLEQRFDKILGFVAGILPMKGMLDQAVLGLEEEIQVISSP